MTLNDGLPSQKSGMHDCVQLICCLTKFYLIIREIILILSGKYTQTPLTYKMSISGIYKNTMFAYNTRPPLVKNIFNTYYFQVMSILFS